MTTTTMMASWCRSPRCSAERRGFRRELDSWRHKLIHCIGFESILEGLYGPGLLRDLSLFDDCEPEEVSDWIVDENCPFCCLRRDKVKEHLSSPSDLDGASDSTDTAEQLERETETFLHALFQRKDPPRACNPAIPLVAREIMYRMIRQFAAEYAQRRDAAAAEKDGCEASPMAPPPAADAATSVPSAKPSCPTSSGTMLAVPSDLEHKAESPPQEPAAIPVKGTAPTPLADDSILSKLLSTQDEHTADEEEEEEEDKDDEDGPLDLSLGKSTQDCKYDQAGVLDLSTKKSMDASKSPSAKASAAGTSRLAAGDLYGEERRRRGSSDSLGLGALRPTGGAGAEADADTRGAATLQGMAKRAIEEGLAELTCLGTSNTDELRVNTSEGRNLAPWLGALLSEGLGSLVKQTESTAVRQDGRHSMSSSSFLQQLALKRMAAQAVRLQDRDISGSGSVSGSVRLKIPQFRVNSSSALSNPLPADVNATSSIDRASPCASSALSTVKDGSSIGRKLKAILPKQQSVSYLPAELHALKILQGSASNNNNNDLALLNGKYLADQDVTRPRSPEVGPLLTGLRQVQGTDNGDPNKQPRRKRGRYRQYDSGILEEAISMVMSGRMSVSKAQALYGIPHSTLEYKVKERAGTLKVPPKRRRVDGESETGSRLAFGFTASVSDCAAFNSGYSTHNDIAPNSTADENDTALNGGE
ncbi:ligand-dependent nuclear receptor corepressor-like protein isoform X2 [Petromyzon marinus]|uniref:Ligand-dependent nuclear receptor corepressor-like protein isoform X3 n=1 Tax=Petromyzon marinus TaxID=7757 RepID=A0AAJ7WS34_PETMA|nr:ligand-dependent nuclear receptor corepressor-like protein isoform X3 [Petromyzon marinus]